MSVHGPAWSGSVFNSFEPAYWGLAAGDFGALMTWGAENADMLWTKTIDDMAKAGVSGLDLGIEPFDWRSAVSWAGTPREFGDRLRDAGLGLSSSYQSGHPLTDLPGNAIELQAFEQRFSKHAEFVAEAGSDTLVLGAPLVSVEPSGARSRQLYEIVNRLGAIAASRGVSLAIHTEAYADWTSEAAIDELMAHTDPQTVFLCPDTGHIALHGGDPVAVLARHWDRIRAFHFKDTRHSLPEITPIDPEEAEARMMREFCIAGEGIVDWPAIAKLVNERGFSGWCVAEVDCAADPVSATTAIIAAIRKAGVKF